MRKSLVTIVIPCYNCGEFVGEAIRSALSQSYQDIEVVVVDDGSTDSSLNVMRSFGGRIRWETGPNRGACAARNRGIELARGELIQFLDADDTLGQNKLQRQVAIAAQVSPKVVYCDIEKIHGNGKREVVSNPPISKDSVVQMILRNMLTPCPLHSKSALLAVGGFRVGLPCSQEWDLHLRLACSGVQFYHLPEVLCSYHLRPGSIAHTSRCGRDMTVESILNAYSALQGASGLTDARRRAFATKMARLGAGFLGNDSHSEKAIRCFAWARQVHSTGGITADFGPWIVRVTHRAFGPSAGVFLWKARAVGMKGILRKLRGLTCFRRH